MFGKKSLDPWKDQSNLYSVQVNPNRPLNISETDIRQFVRILIISGVYSFAQQRFYWTNGTRVQSIAQAMSRDRFLLMKKIYVLMNELFDSRGCLLWNSIFWINRTIGVTRCFFLAGGNSGLCYDFVFYTGKADKTQYDFGIDVTLELCKNVPQNINYKLYFDNYFTTIQLQIELKKLGIFSGGTVRSSRLTDIVMKDEKTLKNRRSMFHGLSYH